MRAEDRDLFSHSELYRRSGPKLAEQAFPPGAETPSREEQEKIVTQLVFEFFPPDEDPRDARKKLAMLDPTLAADLFPVPAIDQAALAKYAAGIVDQVSAKERSVVILAPDGAVLAENNVGQACQSLDLPKAAIDAVGSAAY